ncbi:hypothetical protein JOL79_00050 [Microbispora sp. RL4-1S]|uniref:Uncharacterized protein n=1 Tax=Microbispora oryzae TaxID=2806554 RepID=A0A940WCT9_9ACTN|nr:hypothetical protein [Microbispora oryzae]MBP2702188.1 hypothetical protein [Microbispora oryzae]
MEEYFVLSWIAWKVGVVLTSPEDSWISQRLSPDDLRAMGAVVAQLSDQQSISLLELLFSWQAHVHKFEADLSLPKSDRSAWGAYDLIAALILRDHISEGLDGLDAHVRARVEAVLAEIDNKFISYTEPDDLLRVEKIDARPDRRREWWWKRIPSVGPARDEVILYSGIR